MNRTPSVSVLMPSFNCARYLPLAIRSVLSQSHADLELIIVDDGSTDGSREIAEQWRGMDGRVVTVFHDMNRGVYAARNSGLRVSSGEFVALCDADDIWLRDRLKTQLECFRRDPELGLVHSDSSIIDSDGNLTGQRFSQLFHRKGQVTSGRLFEELCQRNFLCTTTVILRCEAIQYAGGFDGRLRILDDWFCWAKVARKYPFGYIDEPLVQYRIHEGSLSRNPQGLAHDRVKALGALLEAFSDISSKLRSRMLYSLGMSHMVLGDWKAGSRTFLDSAKADVWNFRAWVRCGQALFRGVLGAHAGSDGQRS